MSRFSKGNLAGRTYHQLWKSLISEEMQKCTKEVIQEFLRKKRNSPCGIETVENYSQVICLASVRKTAALTKPLWDPPCPQMVSKKTGFIDTVCYQDSRGLGSSLGTVKKYQETPVFEIYSIKLQLTLLKHLQAPKSPRCPLAVVQTPAVSEELRAECPKREGQSGALPWLGSDPTCAGDTQYPGHQRLVVVHSLLSHLLCNVKVLQVQQPKIKLKPLSLWKSLVYKTFSVWSRKCLTQPKWFQNPGILDVPSSTESSPHP